VREPLFSDQQTTLLAEKKFLRKENLALARRYEICSLQAAEAFDEMLQIFLSAVERVRNQKELSEFLLRLKENAGIQFQPKAEGLLGQKEELTQRIKQEVEKNQEKIARSRGRKKKK